MGWTPPHGIALCQGGGVETRYEEEASMEKVSMVGLDIAKNGFHAHGAAADGIAVFSKALSRARGLEFLQGLERGIVAIEACAGARHRGREITAPGHEVRPIHPQYVKAHVKRQRNDAADAAAIAEAASRPTMRFVAVKGAEQQGQAMVLKTGDLLTGPRTQTIDAPRGRMAGHGPVAPKGPRHLPRLRAIPTASADQLPARGLALCELLLAQIDGLSRQIDALRPRSGGLPGKTTSPGG